MTRSRQCIRGARLAGCVLLAAVGCGTSLSRLDLTTVHVSAQTGDYGGYVLLAWQAGSDACPTLSSSTTVLLVGLRLQPVVLGGKRWTPPDDMPALPHRRCIGEARFKGPVPPIDGRTSRVEISDSVKKVVVEIDQLRAPTDCRLVHPPDKPLIRGTRAEMECTPAVFDVSAARVAFGKAKYENVPKDVSDRRGNTFSFLVADDWHGPGVLTVNVEFRAPVRTCQNVPECVASGRHLVDKTIAVVVE
jgi:hypothetical protein